MQREKRRWRIAYLQHGFKQPGGGQYSLLLLLKALDKRKFDPVVVSGTPKSFLEKKVESDRHVAEYKWLDEAFKDIHPPFYHFWHCPACKYTATQRDFLKPGEDPNSNYGPLKKAFLRMKPSQKQIVQMLAIEKELRFAIREGGRTVGAGVITGIIE